MHVLRTRFANALPYAQIFALFNLAAHQLILVERLNPEFMEHID